MDQLIFGVVSRVISTLVSGWGCELDPCPDRAIKGIAYERTLSLVVSMFRHPLRSPYGIQTPLLKNKRQRIPPKKIFPPCAFAMPS